MGELNDTVENLILLLVAMEECFYVMLNIDYVDTNCALITVWISMLTSHGLM